MENRSIHKQKGFKLALQGLTNKEISKRIPVPYTTICRWAKEGKWHDSDLDPLRQARQRMRYLIHKGNKTKRDFTELDKLGDLVLKFMSAAECELV